MYTYRPLRNRGFASQLVLVARKSCLKLASIVNYFGSHRARKLFDADFEECTTRSSSSRLASDERVTLKSLLHLNYMYTPGHTVCWLVDNPVSIPYLNFSGTRVHFFRFSSATFTLCAVNERRVALLLLVLVLFYLEEHCTGGDEAN